VLQSKRKQLAESLACNNNLHVKRSEAMRSCIAGGPTKKVEMKYASDSQRVKRAVLGFSKLRFKFISRFGQ
jgi:hypothetical protein